MRAVTRARGTEAWEYGPHASAAIAATATTTTADEEPLQRLWSRPFGVMISSDPS